MKAILRIHKTLSVIMLSLACYVLAEAPRFPTTPAKPYRWQNVVMGGGGFVTGIVFHPGQKGLIYVRTDVGGAYRWDSSQGKWIPLTDWLPGVDFTGIESLAVDPNDPNRIYLAAGIYRNTRAAILRSDDQGLTWQQTEVPFKMGGNETGRFNGERLAVDPHAGAILFFGSRHDGLWRSQDHGVTWTNVPGFPAINTTENPAPVTRTNVIRRFRGNYTPQQTGIVFLKFDPRSGSPGNSTPVLYAGVSTLGTNLFRSTDGGLNWEPVPGQPLGLRPNHAELATDGTIYLTYGHEPGPTTMSAGAVWKYLPAGGVWTNITPVIPADEDSSFGYGAVGVDAHDSSKLLVSTFAHWHPHDEIFRSTNGGATWSPLLPGARLDYSNAPYTQKRTPHWLGTVQIDPWDSNQAMFTTGYGLWACHDLEAADKGQPTHWEFMDRGLEETVPLALISPPSGAHLLSGVGDIDGFRHDDLEVSPSEGNFPGPRFSSTDDLAFAGKNPAVMVRAGLGGNTRAHTAISRDGGKNWSALATDPEGGPAGGGSITISSDGRVIVWTPRRTVPYYTTNNGINWERCNGLENGFRVVADTVNPERFYAFASSAGEFFTSTNGAVDFSQAEDTLPASQGPDGGSLAVAPGRQGDLWLATRSGLFHSTDAGQFTRLPKVQSASSIGFGKAAPGKKIPSLFLIGKVGDLQGIFQSDDNGENWVRLNDREHQYGSISHVTGDPRIYGRVYFATSGRGVIYGDPAAE